MVEGEFSEEIAAISIAGHELWRQLQGDPPEILYHYTNAEGLVGIVSSGALWATDLRFVNDASELDHALESMLTAIARARIRFSSPVQLMLLDRLEDVIGQRAMFPSVHSVSFSENGDLLSQWRAYGGDGGGYAIGFAALDLRPDFTGGVPAGGGVIHRVVYDQATQDQLLDDVIAEGCELTERIDQRGGNTERAATALVARLLSGSESGLFYCLKAEGWSEEAEWRTVYALNDTVKPGVEFRTVAGIPVPYLPLHDIRKRLPIREVAVGPSISQPIAETAVRTLLDRYGYTDVDIRISALPLRW
jgi:hypothetical protein